MSKLKLLLALAIGYVAGSAAGRQRYEQIRAGAQKVAESPRVQAAAQRAQDTIAEKAPVVAGAIKDRTVAAAGAVADKVTSDDGVTSDGPVGSGEVPQPPAHPEGGAPLS